MVKARDKGHDFERKIAREFRDLGYSKCRTSRYASREKDDQKVDLVETGPFNVQCKAVEKMSGYHALLREMPAGGVNIIIHRRNRLGEVVVMDKKDFYRLVKK